MFSFTIKDTIKYRIIDSQIENEILTIGKIKKLFEFFLFSFQFVQQGRFKQIKFSR